MSLSTRKRWVIKDRKKVESLLHNLHQFIFSLIELVALPRSFERLLVKEDVDALEDDLSHLRLLQAATQGQNHAWSEFATLRVEAFQKAIQDFRTLEEWLEDVEKGDKASTNSLPRFETDVDGGTFESLNNNLEKDALDLYDAPFGGASATAPQLSDLRTPPVNWYLSMDSKKHNWAQAP